jgi:hypothetical protein
MAGGPHVEVRKIPPPLGKGQRCGGVSAGFYPGIDWPQSICHIRTPGGGFSGLEADHLNLD